jgi:hypothetical protein
MIERQTQVWSASIWALILFNVGCQPLPPGKFDSVRPVSDAPRRGNVYLVRGWRDLYSAGLDRLAGELRQSGVHAEVFRATQWRELAAIIEARYSGTSPHEPLVLIGFSYGADDVLRIAEQLQPPGPSPDLIITLDPVTPPPVPSNVRACYNFFQTNGVWDAFPWLRGIPLISAGAGTVVNIDVRKERPDLLEPNTAHSNIAANPKIHRAIIEHVLTICSRRDSQK